MMQQSSGLPDIIERMAEQKKAADKIKRRNELGKDAEQSDDDQPKHVPLRDRTFTKEELKNLEKKTWIEFKDMIFETDPSILDYLTYHCAKWRKTKRCQLSEEYKLLK